MWEQPAPPALPIQESDSGPRRCDSTQTSAGDGSHKWPEHSFPKEGKAT